MNIYKYRNNTTVFDTKLKTSIEELKRDYNFGKIQTQTEYAYKIKQLVKEFYKNLGKPNMKFIEASDVPSYIHYKTMINNTIKDIKTLSKGCDALNNDLTQSENSLKDTFSNMFEIVSKAEADVNNLENRIASLKGASSILYSDTFKKNTSDTEFNITDAKLLKIDTENGILCLSPTSDTIVTDDMKAQILNTSNGFPGNTHEVMYSKDDFSYKCVNDPHLDLNSIFTNRDDEWFEFEFYSLDKLEKESTAEIGFKYKEGISWIKDEKTLKLNIELFFDESKKMNWFKIKGIARADINTDYPILKKITIRDEDVNVQTIIYDDFMKLENVITFKTQNVKSITLEIEQSDYSITKVVREYMTSVDTSCYNYFDQEEDEYIEEDSMTKSIELLGLKYNQEDKSIIYPTTDRNYNFKTAEYTKSKLFYKNLCDDSYKTQYEVVKANRFSIGINSVECRFMEYKTDGMYISKTFVPSNKIKTIILNAEDYIPTNFSDYLKENEHFDDFIKYYITLDGGETCTRIHPRQRATNGSCTLIVNSDVAVANRNPNNIYIDMLVEPTTVKVKIEMTRPEELKSETPIVYSYNIDIDAEEYI